MINNEVIHDQNLKKRSEGTLKFLLSSFSTRLTIIGGPQAANKVLEVSLGTVYLNFASSMKPVYPVQLSLSALSTEKWHLKLGLLS